MTELQCAQQAISALKQKVAAGGDTIAWDGTGAFVGLVVQQPLVRTSLHKSSRAVPKPAASHHLNPGGHSGAQTNDS